MEYGVKATEQNADKAGVFSHGEKKQDGDESSRNNRVRGVPMPEDMEQNQVSRDEPCARQGERPAAGQEPVVFRHGFGSLGSFTSAMAARVVAKT